MRVSIGNKMKSRIWLFHDIYQSILTSFIFYEYFQKGEEPKWYIGVYWLCVLYDDINRGFLL